MEPLVSELLTDEQSQCSNRLLFVRHCLLQLLSVDRIIVALKRTQRMLTHNRMLTDVIRHVVHRECINKRFDAIQIVQYVSTIEICYRTIAVRCDDTFLFPYRP